MKKSRDVVPVYVYKGRMSVHWTLEGWFCVGGRRPWGFYRGTDGGPRGYGHGWRGGVGGRGREEGVAFYPFGCLSSSHE